MTPIRLIWFYLGCLFGGPLIAIGLYHYSSGSPHGLAEILVGFFLLSFFWSFGFFDGRAARRKVKS